MKRLLKRLAPFAPDHSGAVSVLFELGGLITLCDAGGCTGNVCGFDEPRWEKKTGCCDFQRRPPGYGCHHGPG